MKTCKTCIYLETEYSAGLVDHCFNEEITDEEHDLYRNKKKEGCPYYMPNNKIT